MPFCKLFFPTMRNKAFLPLLVLVLMGVVLSHFNLKTDENGTLLLLDNRPIDIKGEWRDNWTRWTTDCSGVRVLDPVDREYQDAKLLIQAYSPPSSASVKLSSVIIYQDWMLAEAEFEDLLPSVVLIQTSPLPMTIISNAVWSGYTQPWKAAPYIRQYISHQAPQAPNQITNCFYPRSKSFN